MVQYSLSAYDADILTSSREFADWFESAVGTVSPEHKKRAKSIANWMIGEFLKLLNAEGSGISQSKIRPQQLAELIDMIDQGTLSTTLAKQVFGEMFNTGKSASQIVAEKGLTQISGTEEIDLVIDQVLRDNPKAVADFEKGKEQALKFLVGQIMKTTKGRAKPELANKMLKERLR